MNTLLTKDPKQFINQVSETLEKWNRDACLYSDHLYNSSGSSVVLCLFSECLQGKGKGKELCFVFNKRSKWVRQAGDLCFPGGGIHHIDSLAAKFLGWPFFPLGRWPYWKQWKKQRRKEADRLALLLATGLRECAEEMRLNPFRTQFLGPLPPQALQSFQRFLYPMVVWVGHRKRFFLNRGEVEKVVSIPIRSLLNPEKYVRFRMSFEAYVDGEETLQDFPGFLHEDDEGQEVLWGVTYRIVMVILEVLFNFLPPEMDGLPVVSGMRDENYLNSPPRKKNLYHNFRLSAQRRNHKGR